MKIGGLDCKRTSVRNKKTNLIIHQMTYLEMLVIRLKSASHLKEYYEIINEAAHYRHFSPQMLICLHKCISNHEPKQSKCFTINVWKINCFETSKLKLKTIYMIFTCSNFRRVSIKTFNEITLHITLAEHHHAETATCQEWFT